jgi:hydroxymethylpyrimidine/phosphomethylpyrimidine kinase
VSSVLVIAGSDSSGGAGLTRDVDTLARLGARALCALTAVTAQSDRQVSAVHLVPPEVIRAQIEAAFATGRPGAVKIGMLGTRAGVLAVAEALAASPAVPVVLDPVLASSSGRPLLDTDGRAALRETLLPRATLITPNIPEAAALLGAEPAVSEQQLLGQGEALLALGAGAVLLKGGHAAGTHSTDILLTRALPTGAASVQRLSAPRSARSHRGTGCALASAIAAALAQGHDLLQACARGKQYVTALFQQLN